MGVETFRAFSGRARKIPRFRGVLASRLSRAEPETAVSALARGRLPALVSWRFVRFGFALRSLRAGRSGWTQDRKKGLAQRVHLVRLLAFAREPVQQAGNPLDELRQGLAPNPVRRLGRAVASPLRDLEKVGASGFGYTALYLLLAGIGAQADLRAVLDAPVYLLAGAVWIAIHVLVLYFAARLVKAPLFFVATGSMANIGGAATAPVVAGVYHPAMAPVGLLMAVAGYILGIYGAIACAGLLGIVGT